MSIAFLDPGNIEADLQSGAAADYKLFWVLLWSTVLGLLVQRLAARIGTVTGQHLAEVCYSEYRPLPRTFLWLMMEVAIIGSDMQEVIGTAIAIFLLSNRTIPLWKGVLITIFDTFTFVFLDSYGLRKLELFFAFLIATMAFTFGFEFFLSRPEFGEIMEGIFVPMCSGCGKTELMQAIGIVGSCIMPHNLYLHSGLVKTRQVDRTRDESISEANFYYFIESGLALFVSFIINVFVMSVFAKGLYAKTNEDVVSYVKSINAIISFNLQNNTDAVDVDIYSGGAFLGCQFGMAALYIWAVGILAAGQSSTMCGCYSGQFTMEGMLNLKWRRWRRVLFTRSLALLPTLYVASFSTLDAFSGMNDMLNALMSLQLPFAVLPAIAFSSNTRIMGPFANGITNKIIAVLIFCLIVAINSAFVFAFVSTLSGVPSIVSVTIYGCIYIPVTLYLLLHTIAALTSTDSRLNSSQVW
ncbi:hypothetical protein AAG570_002386 [Ranatra chinensis]|uniref:Uncharacterized protein n=1 Tax=Ranatra chinensis TaxID=642074 RepID=A0ABD0Y7D4_9HEMI